MTEPAQAFRIRGEETETLEIDIFDAIGESFLREGVTSKAVRTALRDAKQAKSIVVRIDSGGGDVTDGIAIYNQLRQHGGNVTVHVEGLAASIASVIAMAGDEIVMAEGAFMMVHNPWGLALGEAEDMRQMADLLDKMRDQIVDIYVARTGQPRDAVLAAVSAETWMTADEAKALGYVTKVVPAKKQKKATAAWNVARFNRVPEAVIASIAAARTEEETAMVESKPNTPAGAAEPIVPATAPEESLMNSYLEHVNAKLGLAPEASQADAVMVIDQLQRQAAAAESAMAKMTAENEATCAAFGTEIANLRGEVDRLERNAVNAESKRLIDQAVAARKVLPATRAKAEGIFIKHGLDALKDHLDSLMPVAAAKEVREPASDSDALDSFGATALTHNGKSYENMAPGERAQLRSSGEHGEKQYRELKADWERRGQPKPNRA